MYKTQATIKNVNLRSEFAGEERHGAYDLKVTMPLTADLHKWLTKHIEKDHLINVSALRLAGFASANYAIEFENVKVMIGNLEIVNAKVNKFKCDLTGSNTVEMRIQAGMSVRGMVDDLNSLTNEQVELSFEEMQQDLLDDDKKEVDAGQEKASVTKIDKAKDDVGQEKGTLHTDRGEDDLSEDEKKERENEKKKILAGASGDSSGMEDEATARIAEMVTELDEATLAGDDVTTFATIKEKVDGGRKLTALQVDDLLEIHSQYVKAA